MANEPIGQELGRKLSVQSFGFDKGRILELIMSDKGRDHFLMRAVGTVTDTKAFKSRKLNERGEALEGFGLIGQFECTGPDGEVKTGNPLYLPSYVADAIAGALDAADGDANVDIALDVYVRFDADAATSYVFVVRSLIKADTTAVDRVKAQLSNVPLPGLPAPKK